MKLSIKALAPISCTFLLVSCGGSGGTSPVPSAQAPSVTVPRLVSPNVGAMDTAADWTSSRYDPSGSGDNRLQTAISEANAGTLIPQWIFHGTVGSESSVAVASGVVYRTEQGGNVYAIDENTGAQLWNYAPPGPEGFDPSPLVAGGLVYLAGTTGAFYVVGRQSGQLEFTYPSPASWGPLIGGTEERGHYRGSVAYENGTIYSGASNHEEPDNCIQGGQILALDPLSPRMIASATLTPNGTDGVGVWSTPVFDASGDMFVATGNSCSFTSAPYGDSMLRIDPTTLSVVWSTPGPPDAHDWDFGSTPVVVDDEVIDGAKDGNLYAYDTVSGQLLWKQLAFANGVILGGLATDGSYVAVPYMQSVDSQHGGIAVYDLQGNVKWSLVTGIDPADPGQGVISPPAISNGMLFVGYIKTNCTSACDGLGAFDLATGKQLWWYSTPSPVVGGIVVVSGGVFASEIGNPTVYCFLPHPSGAAVRRPRIIYGTSRGPKEYYRNPWLKNSDYEGDNSGPLR